MSSVEWMNFMSHDSKQNVGKGPFVYKQTYFANLLSCLTLWFNVFLSNNIYCKFLILTDKKMTRQRMI